MVYKSEKYKRKILNVTDSLVESMNLGGKEHLIETSFGKSYCYEIPNPGKPKMIIMHGGQSNHAMTLFVFEFLIENFHVFAFDIPGHAGKSVEVRVNPNSDDYGRWASESIKSLSIESAHFLGLSYGGFVCQRLAVLRPELFETLSLVVPAGIVPMNTKTIMKNLLFPQLGYVLTKSDYFFNLMMKALFTDYNNKFIVEFFKEVLIGVKSDTRQPKLCQIEEFKSFDVPTLIIACEYDILFDAKKLSSRAKEVFRNLKFLELEGQRHSPSITSENRRTLCQKIIHFINDGVIGKSL